METRTWRVNEFTHTHTRAAIHCLHSMKFYHTTQNVCVRVLSTHQHTSNISIDDQLSELLQLNAQDLQGVIVSVQTRRAR